MKETEAKSLIVPHSHQDSWFGCRYTINIYRGCQHQCIYCDSRSECYQIPDFADINVKTNAIKLLETELSHKRIKGTVCTGAMSDPYMPLEAKYKLTRQALEVIAKYHLPVHLMTKSDMVLRDLDLLKKISNATYAAVSFTITTSDDKLSKILEPGAPPSSARFAAIRKLSDNGIYTGICMMPILPFIEDTEENITQIVEKAAKAGARYILPAFAVTMRDRQREYFYKELNVKFPGMSEKYRKAFGSNYVCNIPNARKLELLFQSLCKKYKIAWKMEHYIPPEKPEQFKIC